MVVLVVCSSAGRVGSAAVRLNAYTGRRLFFRITYSLSEFIASVLTFAICRIASIANTGPNPHWTEIQCLSFRFYPSVVVTVILRSLAISLPL